MYLNCILASVLTAVILWTGTLIHDVRFIVANGMPTQGACIQGTFSQFQPSHEHDCSRDDHVHDACLTSRFDKELKQIAAPFVGWCICVLSYCEREAVVTVNSKRGPPEIILALARPSKIFLTKCSLLI